MACRPVCVSSTGWLSSLCWLTNTVLVFLTSGHSDSLCLVLAAWLVCWLIMSVAAVIVACRSVCVSSTGWLSSLCWLTNTVLVFLTSGHSDSLCLVLAAWLVCWLIMSVAAVIVACRFVCVSSTGWLFECNALYKYTFYLLYYLLRQKSVWWQHSQSCSSADLCCLLEMVKHFGTSLTILPRPLTSHVVFVCVLQTVTSSLYLAVVSTHMAIGRFRSPVQRSGTRRRTCSEIRRVVLTVLSSFWRQSCLIFTNVTSTLEVSWMLCAT